MLRIFGRKKSGQKKNVQLKPEPDGIGVMRMVIHNPSREPTSTELALIAKFTHQNLHHAEILINVLENQFILGQPYWRRILHSLQILDYCVIEGSYYVFNWTRNNPNLISRLCTEFSSTIDVLNWARESPSLDLSPQFDGFRKIRAILLQLRYLSSSDEDYQTYKASRKSELLHTKKVEQINVALIATVDPDSTQHLREHNTGSPVENNPSEEGKDPRHRPNVDVSPNDYDENEITPPQVVTPSIVMDVDGDQEACRMFERLVIHKLGKSALPRDSIIGSKILDKCLKDFKERIKPNYQQSNKKRWAVKFDIEPVNPTADMRYGCMMFTNDEVLECFENTHKSITEKLDRIHVRSRSLPVTVQHSSPNCSTVADPETKYFANAKTKNEALATTSESALYDTSRRSELLSYGARITPEYEGSGWDSIRSSTERPAYRSDSRLTTVSKEIVNPGPPKDLLRKPLKKLAILNSDDGTAQQDVPSTRQAAKSSSTQDVRESVEHQIRALRPITSSLKSYGQKGVGPEDILYTSPKSINDHIPRCDDRNVDENEVASRQSPQNNANVVSQRHTSSSSQTSTEILSQPLTQRLNTYFSRSDCVETYTDAEIQDISMLLRCFNVRWSKVPRTYIILRIIGHLDDLESCIDMGFSDYWFPVTERSLPDFLRPSSRAAFVKAQNLILTKSMDLEKGEKGQHCTFQKGDVLPLETKAILGSGAYGQVDKVLSLVTFREYARKRVLRSAVFRGQKKEAVRQFISEIEILKRLKHLHIVEFVGSYTDSKYIGLIMTPIADGDLSAYLAVATPSQFPELRTFFGCLATALEFLHENNVRHKDIKSRNVLISYGRALLADFGLSFDFTDATGSTTMSMVNSMTPRYCAPEVAAQGSRNTKADIWSLGIVFVEMVATLKGMALRDIDDFMKQRGTQEPFLRLNIDVFRDLVVYLAERGQTSDNIPLWWIQDMLSMQQENRPTASELVATITSPMRDSESPAFCGICCLAPEEEDFSDYASD